MRNKFGLHTNKQNVIIHKNKLAKTNLQNLQLYFVLNEFLIEEAKQIPVYKNKVTKMMRNKFGLHTNKQNVTTHENKKTKTNFQNL